MVTREQAYRAAVQQLCAVGIENASEEAEWLLEKAAGEGHRLRPETCLSDAQLSVYHTLVQRRTRHYPLQYLLGSWPFLNVELAVGEGVLIPRQDTEIVALEAIRLAETVPTPLVVLDLCSGSGALALALQSRFPAAQITAVEYSGAAFGYLQKNAEAMANRLHCKPIAVVQADAFTFQDTIAAENLSLLVSNPPYLTGQEMAALQPEVGFEPALALDGGTDGLRFYRHIAAAYYSKLRPGGVLVFEIGWQQARQVMALCADCGYRDLCVLQDLEGRDRCITALK